MKFFTNRKDDEKITNASVKPMVYFGLHMVEGVAEYRPHNDDPFRIFVGEQTIKNMDSTFQGKPLYVDHVDQVNLADIQNEADGYVIRSFFNKADGKHWAEFIVVSDRGHDAIRKGWKLSNAYVLKNSALGGKWHGVEYQKEVIEGEYEHLAIVQNPRYDESIILTPEQFKAYNSKKDEELVKLANSSENKPKEKKGMFNIFKKEKIENSNDLEQMSVVLPKSGKEFTITQLITNADMSEVKKAENAGKPCYANGEDMVKIGEEEMSVNSLIEKYEAKNKAKNEEDEEEKKKNKPKNKEEEEEEKKENEEDEEIKNKKAKNSSDENFEKIKNAHENAEVVVVVETSSDQVSRGQNRYGSKK